MIIRQLALLALAPSVAAQVAAGNGIAIDPNLVGTWTTKSQTVFTGPDFYDPVNDKMKEPALTGISYSFTSDGHFEEAYYRAVSNPTTPSCPQGVLQWQHGTFVQNANGSLNLTPINVDGRQLISTPCKYSNSVYERYHQAEFFKSYSVVIDEFHGVRRLNLFRFDGSPANPMYLAYNPPQMLPTQTLNPTASHTSTSGAQQTSQGASKVKRSEGAAVDDAFYPPLNKRAVEQGVTQSRISDPDTWWWFGVGATALGGLAYYVF